MKKILTTSIILMASLAQAEVMINEVMADNGGAYPNAAGEAMDWLELYNVGATPVDLTGWRITDTVEDEWSKWKEIPAGTTVPAGGYLLLWGHNKDFPTPDDKKGFCGVTNGEVHVKLGLSSKGETITLAASEADYNATNFADQVTFGAQFADVSYGRDPGDTAKWLFFTNATPGAANGSDGLAKYPPEEEPGGDDDPGDVSGDTELETKLLKIGLPVVVIDTVNQEEPTCDMVQCPYFPATTLSNDNTKVPGRLRIKTAAGTEYDSGNYEKKKSGMTVKYRGNVSARGAKKPYKIKLQAPADLLARGDDASYQSKDWVLLASTETLKNVLGFMINDIVGLPWSPGVRYVNVVFNGDYRGLFQIVESVERAESRVDVAEDGYIYELDVYYWNEDVFIRTEMCNINEGYTFKHPDAEGMTPEKIVSASNMIVNVERSIVDGTYQHAIDVKSWACWLLGQDILGNDDARGANLYFMKYDDSPDSLVGMPTMWDLDNAYSTKDEWCVAHTLQTMYSFPFRKLVKSSNHAFNNAYVRKWLEIRSQIVPRVEAKLEEMRASGLLDAIDASRKLDGERWGVTRRTVAQSLVITRNWYGDRVNWIDEHISEMTTDQGFAVFINELNADEDWVELFNADDRDADISGWRLSDEIGDKAWKKGETLPVGTVVPAGGYLIVRADDFTGWTNGEVHVNLGFSSKGEAVTLARSEGEIVDSFAFGPQHPDVSFGRDPSDPERFVYFRMPTPGAANGNDGIESGDCFNIRVNELMAENGGKFPNAAGEAMDWLELYNAGAADVNVSGWGFQDDPTKAWSKWKTLPEGAVVPAGGYLLVWGDNKDFNSYTGVTNGEVHVNMGLSKKGEGLHLALTNGVGTVVRIDGFDFPKQAPDVSWGRTASDPDKFLYFTEPTPAAANGDAGREALVFSIDFDSDGGTLVASVTNDYGATISAPTAPTRTGYTFAGWYESGAAEPFVFSTMPARDVALTARWTANEYTVRFNANGGTGTMADQTFQYDEEQVLRANVFIRMGYVFAGWNVSAPRSGDAAGTAGDGAVVRNLTTEADGVVTLYAVWNVADLVDPSEMHVDAEKGEKAPYEDAAAVYDGSLYEGEKIVGSVQVKVARGKVDKSGVFSAKVTAMVQLAGEAKKLNFKGGFADEKGAITEMMDKSGNKLAVTVGARGLGGGFTEAIPAVTYRIDGARNVFIGKSAEDKSAASEAVRLYQGAYNVAFDGGTLSVSVDKKGKAKIAGTVEGNKVSATSQLVVGKDAAVVPVVITKKKVNVAFCLWVMSDGTVEVHGADSATSGQETASPLWVAGKAGTLKDGAKFGVDGAALVRVLPGLFGVYLPNGIDVAANGTKWTVAGGVKAGKVAFVKGGDTIDESKLGTNPSGLKLTYKQKDGTFKGSFKAYSLGSNGKIKSYTANVAGVMIGAKGYGTATVKKPACTLLVTIE